MIIKRMYATFGKLDEAKLELKEGMNVLYGLNESGKSTWSAFLRVMLYGISTKERTKSGAMADKEKYAPWSGKPMYGKIEFSWQGKDYVLERTSGRGLVLQAAKITELESGKVLDIPEPVGETLLGIRREVYERTAFIGQAQLAIQGDKAGELERKICALATTGEEDVSHKIIIERLEKEQRALKYNKRGEIPRLEEEIYQINRTIETAEDEEAQLLNFRTELAEIKGREAEMVAAAERAKILAARKVLTSIREAEVEVMGEKRDLATHREKQVLTHAQADEIREKNKLYGEKRRNYTECCERVAEERGKDREQLPESIGISHLLISVAIALVTGLLGLAFIGIFGAAVAIVGFIVPFFILKSAAYKKIGVKNGEELKARRDEAAKSAQTIVILEEERERAYGEMCRAADNLNSILKMVPGGYTAEIAEDLLATAEEYWNTEKMLEARVDARATRLEALKQDRNMEELEALAAKEVSAEGLNLPEEQIGAVIANLRESAVHRSRSIAALEERIRARGEIATLTQKKSKLEAELLENTKKYNALATAIHTMNEIQQEMTGKFAPEVSKKAGEIFEYLTGEHFKVVRIEDAELNLTVAENDATRGRNILQLSGGTLDELYLSLRLALILTLLGEEVPVLLDDAFVNFDEGRMTLALDYLEKLAKERQIMVFTCHSREVMFAKERNLNTETLA